jgi:hypothetical protein
MAAIAACEIGNRDHSGPPLHGPRPLLSVQFPTNWPVTPMGLEYCFGFLDVFCRITSDVPYYAQAKEVSRKKRN